jgi:RNA polymerase sigma factor (sigma-70 family)
VPGLAWNSTGIMATRPQSDKGRPGSPAAGSGDGSAGAAGRTQGAFDSSVLVHLDAAYRLARYLTRRGDAAEDIVQEAMLRAYRSFESQRGEHIRPWLLAIVRNCFLTWKARNGPSQGEQRDRDGREPPDEVFEESCERETPESILIQHEESGRVRALIEALPDIFREVLVLRDVEDMSYREIAEITGVPIGTVMSRLARARKMFAAAWKGSDKQLSGKVMP